MWQRTQQYAQNDVRFITLRRTAEFLPRTGKSTFSANNKRSIGDYAPQNLNYPHAGNSLTRISKARGTRETQKSIFVTRAIQEKCPWREVYVGRAQINEDGEKLATRNGAWVSNNSARRYLFAWSLTFSLRAVLLESSWLFIEWSTSLEACRFFCIEKREKQTERERKRNNWNIDYTILNYRKFDICIYIECLNNMPCASHNN